MLLVDTNSLRHLPRRSSKNCDMQVAIPATDRLKNNYSIYIDDTEERRRGPVVGRSLWTRPARVQSPGWEARIIRPCVKTWLSTLETVNLS